MMRRRAPARTGSGRLYPVGGHGGGAWRNLPTKHAPDIGLARISLAQLVLLCTRLDACYYTTSMLGSTDDHQGPQDVNRALAPHSCMGHEEQWTEANSVSPTLVSHTPRTLATLEGA